MFSNEGHHMIPLCGIVCGIVIGVWLIVHPWRVAMPTKQDENEKLDQWNKEASYLERKNP